MMRHFQPLLHYQFETNYSKSHSRARHIYIFKFYSVALYITNMVRLMQYYLPLNWSWT